MTGTVGSGTNGAALGTYNLTSAQYSLSKRTNLYAIYGQQRITGKDAAVNDKISTSQYALGLRTTF